MTISELLARLITQGLLPSGLNEAKEAFASAVLDLGIQDSVGLDPNESIGEGYVTRITTLLQKNNGRGKSSTAIARAPKPTPRAIDNAPEGISLGENPTVELLIQTALQRRADGFGAMVATRLNTLFEEQEMAADALIERLRPDIEAAYQAATEREVQSMIAAIGGAK